MSAISEREKPVVDILARVNALDIESLLRKELGAFAFAQARPNIELTFQMTRALAQSELSLLPARMLKRVEEFARSVFSLFTEISRLSPNTASASERDRLSNNLATYYQDYFNDLALFLGYSSTRAAGLERISERIRQADALLAEMEKMRDSAKQAVQEQAVSRYAVYFQQDADTHRMAGYGWLFVTIVLFAVTAVLIWHEFVHASLTAFQAFSAPQSIQFAVGRVIFVSLLLSAVIWSGRMYRAHRHNQIVSGHRSNALKTFEVFIRSALDQQTKNAVLLQTTKCIFSQQVSGYLTNEPEAVGSPQILEIIRGIAAGQEK